jgi:hypothetical protein
MVKVNTMKVAERLRLIREIARKLSSEDRGIINLTLEQYQLPVTRSSKREPLNYVLHQIAKANDEVVLDLASHLDIEADRSTPPAGFWKDGNVKLFISHLARRKEAAAELRDELQQVAVSGFVAHNDITPSKEWQQEIELALQTCDALVALMVEGFHQSFWTDHEVGFVFGRGLPIIPVNMGENPYGFMGRFQACRFHDVEKLAETIFKTLINDPRTAKKMSYALVAQFERSGSFASAGQNLKLLKKMKYWDDNLIAVKKNDQIKGSFDVPEGVQSLLKKLKSKSA